MLTSHPSIAAAARSTRPAIGAAGLLAISWLAALQPAVAADEEAERALLRQSWEQTCARYDDRIDWTTRQACNLAWFRAHEKGVWQHNLNPHGPVAAGPSS